MAYSEVFPWWLFVLIHHRCRCFCNEAASCINTLHIHPSTLQQLFCNSISKIKSNHEFLCKRKDSNISSNRIDVTSNYMKKIKFKVHSILHFLTTLFRRGWILPFQQNLQPLGWEMEQIFCKYGQFLSREHLPSFHHIATAVKSIQDTNNKVHRQSKSNT